MDAEHTGVVIAFDPARGLGEVEGADGRRVPFHCTQIADGSRAVAVGTVVRYELVPGHLGHWEATAVTPVSPT